MTLFERAQKYLMDFYRRHQTLPFEEFFLLYQPQYRLDTGTLCAVESLSRWKNPYLGFVPPDIFIEIIERNQWIHSFSLWLVRTALHDYLHWYHNTGRTLPISINVSPLQMMERFGRPFILMVEKELDVHQVCRAHLKFELTETDVEIDKMKDGIEFAHQKGFSLLLDDFGSRNSSFYRLLFFPIEQIKIDRNIIKGIEHQKNAWVLVKKITEMAHEMNLDLVAEGIETEEQQKILQQFNVPIGQGYLLGRPMTAEAIQKLLQQDAQLVSRS